jgi:NAD(P)H-dependent FMN reductase
MAGTIKLILISGSLRSGSVNTAVLRTAQAVAGVDARLYDGLAGLPHFNPDDDPDGGPVPPSVAELRGLLRNADGVLICTPEYAGALPGALKNLLEWTVGGGDTYEKPVAWINASARADAAHQSLRAVLGYTGVDLVEVACRRVVVPRSAIGDDGLVSDPDLRAVIADAVRALADHCAAPAATERPPSGPASLEESVRRADAAFLAALGREDAAGLDSLLAPDFILVDTAGVVHDRAAALAVAVGCTEIDADPDGPIVRVYGVDTAVVVGRSGASRYTHVYRGAGGQWLLASAHATSIRSG